jgi:hypothetical protein
VFVGLGIHNAMRMLIHGMIFGKKVIELKICIVVFPKTVVYNISHSKKNLGAQIYIGRHVKYPLFLADSNET